MHLSAHIVRPWTALRMACSAIVVAGILSPVTAANGTRQGTLNMPVPVKDTAFNRFAANVYDSESEFHACLKAGSPYTLLVFCNGTQAGELDSAETVQFLSRHRDFRKRLDGTKDGAAAFRAFRTWLYGRGSFLGTVSDSTLDITAKLRKVAVMGAWPCGLVVENSFDAAASWEVVGRNFLHCTVLARLYCIYAGIGYHGAMFAGPLTDMLQSDRENHFNNNPFSWSMGLPFIRYEMLLGAPVLPYYFWLESNIKEIMNHAEEGTTLARAEWRWEREYLDNRAHVIHFRAGHFAADLLFDRYVYRQGILRVSVERLPSLFGTWGVSWTRAADVWIPGIELEFPQIAYRGFSAGGYRFPLAVMPLRAHFDYYDASRFSLGYTMNIRVEFRKNGLAGPADRPSKRLPR